LEKTQSESERERNQEFLISTSGKIKKKKKREKDKKVVVSTWGVTGDIEGGEGYYSLGRRGEVNKSPGTCQGINLQIKMNEQGQKVSNWKPRGRKGVKKARG